MSNAITEEIELLSWDTFGKFWYWRIAACTPVAVAPAATTAVGKHAQFLAKDDGRAGEGKTTYSTLETLSLADYEQRLYEKMRLAEDRAVLFNRLRLTYDVAACVLAVFCPELKVLNKVIDIATKVFDGVAAADKGELNKYLGTQFLEFVAGKAIGSFVGMKLSKYEIDVKTAVKGKAAGEKSPDMKNIFQSSVSTIGGRLSSEELNDLPWRREWMAVVDFRMAHDPEYAKQVAEAAQKVSTGLMTRAAMTYNGVFVPQALPGAPGPRTFVLPHDTFRLPVRIFIPGTVQPSVYPR